jgi:hypothetical protein
MLYDTQIAADLVARDNLSGSADVWIGWRDAVTGADEDAGSVWGD